MTTGTGIESRLLRNISWQALTVCLRALVSVVALAVLARLSGPSLMGLFGTAWVGPAITLALLQAGPGQSLFLIKDLRPRHITAAFWSTAGLAAIAFGVIACTGPIMATALGIPELSRAQTIAAAFVPLMGLGVVDMALTQRDLNFRMVAVVQTVATVLAAIVAVLLAWIWDPLVGLCALQGALGPFQFLLFRLVGRRPLAFSTGWTELREVWAHGGNLLANSLTASALTNLPQLLLAAMLPVEQLGLFTLSRRIIELINNQIGGMVGQVLFPTIAAKSDDLRAVATLYLQSSRLTVTIMMIPLVVIMAAPEGVLALFAGEAWRHGALVLLLLAIMQVGLSMSQNVVWVMQAIGRASTVWRWNLALIAWQAAFLWILGGSSAATAAGAMAASTIVMPIPAYLLSRYLGYDMFLWARNMTLVIVPGLAIGFAVHLLAVPLLPPNSHSPIFVAAGIVASLCYVLVMVRLEPTIWRVIRSRLHIRSA